MAINKDTLKQTLGEQAVGRFITDDMAIGLGSGTTAVWAMRTISHKYELGQLSNIACVSTGAGVQLEALSYNLPTYDLNHPKVCVLDVAIDGADQFDAQGNLVKGGGGCLLLEKIVAYSAKLFVVLVTEDKLVESLGISFPLPIEVIPSALTRVKKSLQARYKIRDIVLRKDANTIGPWITESGNYLLDLTFAQHYDPVFLEQTLVSIVGVVEVGMFTQKKPILMVIKNDGAIETITH